MQGTGEELVWQKPVLTVEDLAEVPIDFMLPQVPEGLQKDIRRACMALGYKAKESVAVVQVVGAQIDRPRSFKAL